MSDNPFRDLPGPNPYAPPTPEWGGPPPGNPLLVPAIFLLTLAVSFVLLIVASLPEQIARIRAIDSSTSEGAGELFGNIASLILWPLMNLVIVLGAIAMLRLKGYRTAYTAAILATLPCCSPCFLLGIPFGVWSIVLLNRPEVKQRFTG